MTLRWRHTTALNGLGTVTGRRGPATRSFCVECIIVLMAAALPRAAVAQLPIFIDRGVCPGEGCARFGVWRALQDIPVLSTPQDTLTPTSLVGSGELVCALESEVHTAPGIFVVKRTHEEYAPGDTIVVYTYRGEGWFLVEHRNRRYDEDLGFGPWGGVSGSRCEARDGCWGELQHPLELTWWVRIDDLQGVAGWVRAFRVLDQRVPRSADPEFFERCDERRYASQAGQDSQVTDSLLLFAASRIADAAPALEELWPGYWPSSQSFIIAQPRVRVLLITGKQAPSGFTLLSPGKVPASVRGNAYIFDGVHPELDSSQGDFPYDLDFLVGGAPAPAVSYKDSLVDMYQTLFHEAFHAFQQRRFPARTQPESEADEETLSSRSFNALAEIERRMLADVVVSHIDVDSVRALLRSYLAVRSYRLNGVADQVRSLERELEVVEGTAQYIGYAAAAAVAGDDSAVSRWVERDLTQELVVPRMGNPFYWRHRTRVYGTGAAIALLLDRLRFNWRSGVEAGQSLDGMLGDALRGNHPPIDVDALLERLGYDPRLEQHDGQTFPPLNDGS